MKAKPKEISKVELFTKRIKKKSEIFFEVYTKDRHLTKGEKKHLYELKLFNEGIAKEQVDINTAEKSIPFLKMYEEGICQVKDTFFAKIVEFEDINYKLLEDWEREGVKKTYERLINHFDPSYRAELFFFNRKVSEESLKERFEIEKQNDEFDEIREEYVTMLKNQAAKGNNGIVKSKFILFGCDCESYEVALNKLEKEADDVISLLNGIGAIAKSLKGKEWLYLLYEYFCQTPNKKFDFSFKDYEEKGLSEKEAIVPKSFNFSAKDEFKTGSNFGRSYVLEINNSSLNDDFLQNLLLVEGNFSFSIHLRTIKPSDALKEAKGNITRIQSAKIDQQKKAFRGGYDMDILPPDINTNEKDALKLLDELNSADQKLLHTNFIVNIFGKTRQEREILYQSISNIVQSNSCELTLYNYLQEQCFFTGSPLLFNDFSKIKERSITTKALGILIPFYTQDLFMDGNATYYGLNSLSNKMILADRKRLRTPNGLILGSPGSGKSFSAKREIISCFLQTRDEIIICDPEGEYFPVVDALGGQVVKLATNSKAYLNPMDIQISHKNDKDALLLKSSFIITLLDQIAGGVEGLGNDEKGIIDECIRHIYDDYFANPIPENMPILTDLYEALLKYDPLSENPYMEDNLCIEAKRQATRIANSLKLYVSGSQNYFNHRSNVDSDNRILCFDIKDLSKQLKDIGMLIVQDAVWNRVSKNRERGISTRYYCDEFHLLLKEKQTADYSIEMWKRFRKWGGIPTGLTQNIADFLQGHDIEGIVGNSDFIYIFSCGHDDREILAEKYKLTKEQVEKITNAEKGCGLLIYDHYIIPFTDHYPENTKTFEIMNTKPKEEVDYDGFG